MKKNNKKKKNRRMRGRELATWKIVLVSIIAVLLVLAASVCVFLEVYEPNVQDDGPYVSSEGIFRLERVDKVHKNYLIPALHNLRARIYGGIHRELSEGFERRQGVYNFLVLGHDKVALNTDVMMVVNYDVNNGAINILQIPRDTYFEHDMYPNKINSLLANSYYKAYNAGEKNLFQAALSDMTDQLEKAMNIQIDNYVLVNLQAFENIVDIIGGVPIDVPADMDYDDPYQDLHIHIKKGYQVLDGKTAAGFVRFRSGYLEADIGRQNAQKLFLTAFFKKVKSSMTVDKIAKLAEEALRSVTTDINAADAVYFAKSVLSLGLEDMKMMNIPGYPVNADGASYYVVYRKEMLEIINSYFNVYNKDITDALFDQDKLFTKESNSLINSVYTSKDGGYTVNSGDKIDESGIYIPRVWYTTEAATDVSETTDETDGTDENGETEETDSDVLTDEDTSESETNSSDETTDEGESDEESDTETEDMTEELVEDSDEETESYTEEETEVE